MTQNEYYNLSNDLQRLAKIIPLQWGNIQNDDFDSKIDMFLINNYVELEKQISKLNDISKNYFRRRWFLWKCAQCDEHIFSMNNNVKKNPNAKDQSYDIEFNNNPLLRFDIKGTVIPKMYRNDIVEIIKSPKNMINFFYEKQSTGIRNHIQNRLFIVHHSLIKQEREMYLRCHWAFKEKIYKKYSENISINSNFINYENVIADVVFIIENKDKSITNTFLSIK